MVHFDHEKESDLSTTVIFKPTTTINTRTSSSLGLNSSTAFKRSYPNKFLSHSNKQPWKKQAKIYQLQ